MAARRGFIAAAQRLAGAELAGLAGDGEPSRRRVNLAALGLPLIRIDYGELAETSERYPFDRVGWEFIARAGQLAELVVAQTGTLPRAAGPGPKPGRRALTLDEAVIGGLLVRVAKLLRALFDSTQSEQSEAHHILARCAVEHSRGPALATTGQRPRAIPALPEADSVPDLVEAPSTSRPPRPARTTSPTTSTSGSKAPSSPSCGLRAWSEKTSLPRQGAGGRGASVSGWRTWASKAST